MANRYVGRRSLGGLSSYQKLKYENDELLRAAKLGLELAESWMLSEFSGTSLLEDAMEKLVPIRIAVIRAACRRRVQ